MWSNSMIMSVSMTVERSSFSSNFDRFRHVDSEYDIVKSDLVIDSWFPKKNL